MKYLKQILITATCAAIASTASAATDFTNPDPPADSLISNPDNWSNGLPTPVGDPPVANPGTISVNAGFDTNVTHTGYDVVHSAGTLSRTANFGAFALSGSTWLMNATAMINSRGLNLTNSSTFEIDLGPGTADFSQNNVDIFVNSSSSLTVTTGNLKGGRSLSVNGGTFAMNSSGTVTFALTTSAFGTTGLGTNGIMNLNAGAISANRLALRGGTDVNFGGSTAGSATFADWGTGLYTNTGDRAQDNNFTLNFKAATQMALALGAAARALDFTNDATSNPTTLAWAEALWNRGQLIYTDGATVVSGFDSDSETNGWTIVTWADATNSGVGFGTASSEYFEWTADGSFGGSLSLGSVASSGPEIAVEQPVLTDIANSGSQGFGNVTLGSGTSLTFTIRNTGGSALNLTGTPPDYVTVSGDSDFTVTAQPSATVSASGGTSTFTVQFTPSAAGARSAVLSIANDDSNENLFTINLIGTGSETSANPYEDWAGDEAFGDDANGDGVENGLAFLLGAESPTSAVTRPTVSHASGKLVLSFSMRNSDNRGTATLSVQHSSDLGIGDPWSAGATVPTNGGGVTFNVTPGDPLDSVVAEISSDEAAFGKLFGRLKAQP